MRRPLSIIFIIVLIIIALIFIRGNQNPGQPEQAQPNNPNTQTAPSAQESAISPTAGQSVTAGQTKEFTVSGTNFDFSPAQISVNKGDKVKITFKDEDGTHDLSIDGYNVKTSVISAGQDASVEFTADKSGSFEYFCSVNGHRGLGMTGTLTVK